MRNQSSTINDGKYFGTRPPTKWARHGRDFPAPGKYDLITKLSDKISYSLGRKSRVKDNDNPGPGAYEVDRPKNTSAALEVLKYHSRNQSVLPIPNLRLKATKSEHTIPIAYKGHDDWSHSHKGTKFTSSIKQLQFTPYTNDIPGPGSYNHTIHTIGSVGPHVSVLSKISRKDPRAEFPGPGSYNDSGPDYK
jgi:hypothetical protein